MTLRLWLYVGAAALLAFGAWQTYEAGYESGRAKVQGQWDAERADTLQAQANEQAKAIEREKQLRAAIAQQREEHRREIDRINAGHRELVDSLRERAEARAGAGGVPEGAAAGVGCTGEGLARPDAEFLAGFAADAARLQLALETCRAAYNSVKDQLSRD
jgi:hypothetical protein